jgi:peptidyl-prolyl cis-trans isomerase C
MVLEAEKRNIDKLPELKYVLDRETNKRLINKISGLLVDGQLHVKESELLDAYEKFDLGWEVWPAHILSETEEDAWKVIDELHKGTSFSEVAKQYSKADDAIKGGNLGSFFGQGDVVPALREATFFLDEGEFSEPILTKDGWEIVKILKKRRKDYATLRGYITERMLKKKWAERRRIVVDSLSERRGLSIKRNKVHNVLRGIFRKGLTLENANEEFVSYQGGRILVGDAVQGIRDLKKGALPPDSTAVFGEIERWILPDSLFVLEARDQGLDNDPNIVAFRAQRQVALVINQLRMEQISGKVIIPDERVTAYYEEYLDTYKKLPGVINMTEVLVETKEEAEQVLQLARDGESMEKLATRHSVRPGMEKLGGHAFTDSGRVEIASLFQSPYRTFFGDSNDKDVGVVQGPLEVQDRFSVFRLDIPFEKEAIPFKQVKRPIRVKLREQEETKIFNTFLDSLRSEYQSQVEWNEDALARHFDKR